MTAFDSGAGTPGNNGITVKWGDAGLVDCYLRGGIDPKKCEKTPNGEYSTFTKD